MGGSLSVRSGVALRLASCILGGWLVASVFLWRHDATDGLNAFMIGLLIFIVAALAIWAPAFRIGNAFLGAWLFASALFFRHEIPATLWNDALVGAAVFALSLVPTRAVEFREARTRP